MHTNDNNITITWDMPVNTDRTTTANRPVFVVKDSLLCRLCDEKTETVNHLIAGCKVLGGKEYKDRFENVARTIHWQLCRKYQIECNAENLWGHVREKVVERENIKILWDHFNVYADRKIKGRRPNIIVIDERKKKVKVIDIKVPTDHWVDEKEMEKIDKYQDLNREIERLWNVKTMVVPIVIGLLGTISNSLMTMFRD